jgi:hypothetical protein
VRVLGWGGTVAAFCFVSVEQCVFRSDVVFCFSGVCHIYVYIKGVWRGMAVGEGCGVDLFGGVGEHPWGIYLCLNFVLQEQIKEIIIFLGVLVCVYQ